MTLPPRLARKQNRTARWKSSAHCNFVRSHHCVVPGCMATPIEVAHVRVGTDGAMGRKPSDYFTVSLCRDHHAQQHNIGEVDFQNLHEIDLHELAAAFANASPKAREIREARGG